MEKSKIDVSIVVVTMNHLPKLKNLLKSIDQLDGSSFTYELIIIDNCSTDGTADYVTQNYPSAKIFVNSKVNGFAYNNNYGALLSQGEYIFICNPDVVLLDGSLKSLLDYSVKNPKSAIVSPQLLNTDYSYQSSIRQFHSFKILFWRLLSRAKDQSNTKIINDYLMLDVDKTTIQKIDWAIGAAMLIRRDLYINELSGFDENFFLYVEDQDLCLRAWKLGYDVVYNPMAVMIHDHQRSSVKKLNKHTLFHLKSLIYFVLKHGLLFGAVSRENNQEFRNKSEMVNKELQLN